MKKKTKKLEEFIDNLNSYIVESPQLRQDTKNKNEQFIQAEIRSLIIRYLEKHFEDLGYADYVAKANKSFYWEGQEGTFGNVRETVFGGRNYPDFIITSPYIIAVEYKKGNTAALVKQVIGQSLMHTMSGQFDYSYVLFQDENADKRIKSSQSNGIETEVLGTLKNNFNIFTYFN